MVDLFLVFGLAHRFVLLSYIHFHIDTGGTTYVVNLLLPFQAYSEPRLF